MISREVEGVEIKETWGIPVARIEEFFLSQDDVQKCGEGVFLSEHCRISITVRPPREFGALSFPATRIEFSGPDRETEMIHRRFVLQFVSAGA